MYMSSNEQEREYEEGVEADEGKRSRDKEINR